MSAPGTGAPPSPGAAGPGPEEITAPANGLLHHLLRWAGPPEADTVFLLHGFLDLGWSMEPLAAALRRAGTGATLLAPDWRGHGDSGWVGEGGYYHFVDYVADLEELAERLGSGRVFLVGHSMGGMASSLYAGAFPERVAGLVNVEGLGPPAGHFTEAPEKTRAWAQRLRQTRGLRSSPAGYSSLEEATERLRRANPHLDPSWARTLAGHGTRRTADGRWVWKYDPLHRTPSALPFYLHQAMAFWRRVTAPVLLVDAERSPWRALPDLSARKECFPRRQERLVPDAGHMVHQEAPEALGALIARFIESVRAGSFVPDEGPAA